MATLVPLRRRRGRQFALIVAWALAVLLAACAGAPAAPPAPAGAPSAATAESGRAPSVPSAPASLTAVRVAMPTIDLSNLPLAVGIWKGWYRGVGLDVELVRIGGQAAFPSLLNGEVSYLFGWGAASGGIVQGAAIKILAILLD